jgi:hypothetical protein
MRNAKHCAVAAKHHAKQCGFALFARVYYFRFVTAAFKKSPHFVKIIEARVFFLVCDYPNGFHF